MIPCDDLPLAEFLQGDLNPAGEDAVARHLGGCGLCRERLLVMQCLDSLCFKNQEPGVGSARWKSGLAAALVAAAITLPLALWGFFPRDLGDVPLVTEPKHVDFPLRTRARQTEEPTRRRALEAYARQDFARAERLLSELPDQPETLFYRGVSLYLLGEVDRAILLLERVRRGGSRWGLPAAWYEANALLKRGSRAEAVEILTKFAETEGYYRERSRTLLTELGEEIE